MLLDLVSRSQIMVNVLKLHAKKTLTNSADPDQTATSEAV